MDMYKKISTYLLGFVWLFLNSLSVQGSQPCSSTRYLAEGIGDIVLVQKFDPTQGPTNQLSLRGQTAQLKSGITSVALNSVNCTVPCTSIDELVANVECLTGASLAPSGAITQPGLYRLCGNVAGPVVIMSNDVTLDLNGYSISSVTPTTSCALLIDNCNNVTIQNGIIGPVENTSTGTASTPSWQNRGIAIVAQSSTINLVNLQVTGCLQNGIDVSQSSNIIVRNCTFENCATGFYANQSNNINIKDAQAMTNNIAGFEFFNCTNNNINSCQAVNNGGNNNSYGFLSSGGTGNIWNKCSAAGTTITLTSTIGINPLAILASGLVFQDFEKQSIMQNCVANGTEGLFGASAYGALLKTKSFVPQTIFTGIPGTMSYLYYCLES